MSTLAIQTNTLYLSGAGVIIGATSASLTNLVDIYGNVLTMADFGTVGYITFEPDSTNEESATFTGITVNANGTYTLTGVKTVLAKSPFTQTSGLVRTHSGGTKVVITDTAAWWNQIPFKDNNETITGSWTFNTSPVALSATPASTAALGNVKLSQAASKSLSTATITIATPAVVTNTAHGLIAADSFQFTTTGALPTGMSASTTYYVIAAGLTANTFQFSLTVGGAAINTSGTQSGVHTLFRLTPFAVVDNDSRILQNAYAVDTGVANVYAITLATNPTAYATGQVFLFKALNANNAASTLNVNGLGAKTIKKDNTADIASGDILANQIVEVVYDGVNFLLASRTQTSNVNTQTFTGNGTWTKPSSGTLARIQVWGPGGGGGGGGNAGGGGGGVYNERIIALSSLGATEAVALGTGGTGGSSANGNIGSNTTFGAWLTGYAGGGGAFNASSAVNVTGGGGGGTLGQGNTGGNGGTPGSPLSGNGVSAAVGGDGQFSSAGGGASGSAAFAGGNSFYGGAGGGGQHGGATAAGGTTTLGGAGGAGGGATGVAGTQPGGGGGAGGATGGAGGAGQCIVTVT